MGCCLLQNSSFSSTHGQPRTEPVRQARPPEVATKPPRTEPKTEYTKKEEDGDVFFVNNSTKEKVDILNGVCLYVLDTCASLTAL